MSIFPSYAKIASATTGTGTITLGAAITGFSSLAQMGVVDGQTIQYAILDGTAEEIANGVYSSGAGTLTRSTVTSTNSNNPLNLTGAQKIFYPVAAVMFDHSDVKFQSWPVGSVFTAVVATNPATLLGYGTWSAIAAGRVLVGLDSGDTDFDTVEETGGAKTVTLTAAEMPAHTHVQDAHTHTQNSHNHTQDAHSHTQASTTTSTGSSSVRLGTTDTSATAENTGAATATNQAATAVNQNATATNQNTGGGGAHNNVQPYFVVYFWKRTA